MERGVEGEDDGAGLVVDDEEGWGQGGAGVVEVTWWGPGWVKIGLVKDFDVSWAGESGVPDLESEFQLKLGEQGEGSRLLSNSYIVCQSNATRSRSCVALSCSFGYIA